MTNDQNKSIGIPVTKYFWVFNHFQPALQTNFLTNSLAPALSGRLYLNLELGILGGFLKCQEHCLFAC